MRSRNSTSTRTSLFIRPRLAVADFDSANYGVSKYECKLPLHECLFVISKWIILWQQCSTLVLWSFVKVDGGYRELRVFRRLFTCKSTSWGIRVWVTLYSLLSIVVFDFFVLWRREGAIEKTSWSFLRTSNTDHNLKLDTAKAYTYLMSFKPVRYVGHVFLCNRLAKTCLLYTYIVKKIMRQFVLLTYLRSAYLGREAKHIEQYTERQVSPTPVLWKVTLLYSLCLDPGHWPWGKELAPYLKIVLKIYILPDEPNPCRLLSAISNREAEKLSVKTSWKVPKGFLPFRWNLFTPPASSKLISGNDQNPKNGNNFIQMC